MSRSTIKKYLNAGRIEPQFARPERQSKLDPYADKLAGWLKTEAGKSRKQRRRLKQLHAYLVVLGFTGSHGRVAAFARNWQADRQRESQTTGRGTFVPLVFGSGEAFQFDWSEDFAVQGVKPIELLRQIQVELHRRPRDDKQIALAIISALAFCLQAAPDQPPPVKVRIGSHFVRQNKTPTRGIV